MLRRVIKSGAAAREGMSAGVDKLADAVASTFGPYGNNWFLDKRNSITNDGVSVAREFHLEDEIENRGASALRESAVKTVEEVGDGTSTAIILARAIYHAVSPLLGKEAVMGAKKSSQIVAQIEAERVEVTDRLMKMATPIETEEQLILSARVSTESEELGKLIGAAQWALGKDGYLLAEETAERTSSVESIKGIRIDNGFGTSQLVNNQEKQILELENVKVILTSYSIKDLRDWKKIMKVLDVVSKSGSSVVAVIARAWTDETVSYCLQNINQGMMKIYPLNAPYVDMQERFKDLAAVTGATFYDSESSNLEDLQIADLGVASKIIARRYDAIIAGAPEEATFERLGKRIKALGEKMAGSQSDFEKRQLAERMAQLKDGFGLIKIGSPSDMERKRLFDKAEDAVQAVRAAFQEGTVAGAGLAFKEISEGLPDDYILKRPLLSLYQQIMSTAPDGFVIEDWVRDPAKVLRVALEKACAVASSFATAEGVITEEFPKRLDEMLGRPAKS